MILGEKFLNVLIWTLRSFGILRLVEVVVANAIDLKILGIS